MTSKAMEPALSSVPRVANAHLFAAEDRTMLLAVDDGRIYPVDDATAHVLDRAMQHGDAPRVAHILSAAGIAPVPRMAALPASPPLRALSLAVAQKCNLGCVYCYAQEGSFGAKENAMSAEVAHAAVDRLLADTPPGGAVTLAYLGGEPLANRALLREVTHYAAARGAAGGVAVRFALTTNGTLLEPQDWALFDEYRFTVTLSIDGGRDSHDLLRPFKSGRGSYDCVMERARLLLGRPSRRSVVIARVTVTPSNIDLLRTLDELAEAGFDGVQFAPVLRAPTGRQEMDGPELDLMLTQLIKCGRRFVERLADGEVYPFLNLIATLRQIHRGERQLYPCGAGNGYLGVSATGGLYACHRFVDDQDGAMGSVTAGVDATRQRQWLTDRQVSAQEPCRSCWARHMCSGGCHYESMHRGRVACDYIRGWLHYCLGVYASLLTSQPQLLRRILAVSAEQ